MNDTSDMDECVHSPSCVPFSQLLMRVYAVVNMELDRLFLYLL